MQGQSETNNSTLIEYGCIESPEFQELTDTPICNTKDDESDRKELTAFYKLNDEIRTMNTPEERMNNGNIYTHLNYTTDLFAKAPINMTDFSS